MKCYFYYLNSSEFISIIEWAGVEVLSPPDLEIVNSTSRGGGVSKGEGIDP